MKRRRATSSKPRGQRQLKRETVPVLVNIEKPVYGGSFLARAGGKAIFTPLTLPGERARVRAIDDHRGYANAELEELISSAPERIAPRCPHFGPCGGCHYQHADYAAQLAIKKAVLRETLERAGVATPERIDLLSAEPWAYRNRVRVAFDADGNPGYRGRRSHAIVPISECPIAAPLLEKAALAAAEFFRPFPRAQCPAEIALFCDAQESALLATVVLANPSRKGIDDFARAMSAKIPALRGVEFVTEGLAGRQPHTATRWGESSLVYRAAEFDYRVDHGAFFQVNRWLADSLVEHVAADYAGNLAWDLFAGVGLFARRLAASFRRVIAVESATASVPALEANLSGSPARAVRATTLDFLRQNRDAERPDLVVVDPPRTGLGSEVAALLNEVAAPAQVYVSCDPATLARDLGALIAGGYAIEQISLADLFPQTFHIESVVHLRRA